MAAVNAGGGGAAEQPGGRRDHDIHPFIFADPITMGASAAELAASNWIAVAALAAPHLLYAVLWFLPHRWLALFKERAVETFEATAGSLKGARRRRARRPPAAAASCPSPSHSPPLLFPRHLTRAVAQFASVAYWYWLRAGPPDLAAVSPARWAAVAALGASGQALNVGIFAAIGSAGVYYGFKLGRRVPWVDGFPFNVVAHPQYVGSAMSVWAGAALLWPGAPAAERAGVALLAAYWTALYVATGWMESAF